METTLIETIACPECKINFDRKSHLSQHLIKKHSYTDEKRKNYLATVKHLRCAKDQRIMKASVITRETVIGEDGLTGTQRGQISAKENASYQKRTERWREINPETGLMYLQEYARKSVETQVTTIDEDGKSIRQIAQEKRLNSIRNGMGFSEVRRRQMVTMRADIDEEGFNGIQRAICKGILTKQEDIDENGLNALQRATIKMIIRLKNDINENGISKWHHAVFKTLETKRNDIDDLGLNSFQRSARKAVETIKKNDPTFYSNNCAKAGRIRVMKDIEFKYGKVMCPNVGKHELDILALIENYTGNTLKRQFFYDGYWIDGYCETTNTVYEIYEGYHYANVDRIGRDDKRQKYIEENLKCTFVIIKEKDYLNGQLILNGENLLK